jgi:hypothetical protein
MTSQNDSHLSQRPKRTTPTTARYFSAGADLETWSKHEWDNGLQVDALQELDALSVRTLNSLYDIIVLKPRTGEVLVRGGKFFPEYTNAFLAGASLGGSFLKLRGIYTGFRMEIHVGLESIITSDVQSIAVVTEASDSPPRGPRPS